MAYEKTQIDTQYTDTTTDKTSAEVVYADNSPIKWFEDYNTVSDSWVKFIGCDNPGHAEHGSSEVVPSGRIKG